MSNENIFIVNSKSLVSGEMQHFLSDKGYRMNVFGEFDDVITSLEKVKPDLVIYEIISLTPEIIENMQELRKMPDFHDIPNVAVLNRATKNLVLFLAQLGIKDILVKPFSKEALLELIDNAIAPIEAGSFRLRENSETSGYHIIELLKPLDIRIANKVDQMVKKMIQRDMINIAFDLRRVARIDSAGIGILIVCKKRLDIANGSMKVGNLSDSLKNSFAMLKIDEIIDLIDDVDALKLQTKAADSNPVQNEEPATSAETDENNTEETTEEKEVVQATEGENE